ncbi:MAG: hypothetical protein ABL889_05355 [Terricaulis sp.]
MGTRSTSVFEFQFLHWFPWITGVTFAASLTLGVGFHIIAHRLNWHRFATYWITGGAIAGTLVLTAALLTMGKLDTLPDAFTDGVQYLAVAVPTGIATAGISWLIRRPDRDAANPPTSAP